MEKVKKQRDSNFELLRIISMFMIIFHHYVVHGDFHFYSQSFNINEFFINIIGIGGKLACNIFILITGYFMIESSFKLEKYIKLVLKMFIYGCLISIIFFGGKIIEFNFQVLIKELLPILYGNWFLVYYLIMYWISPLLNKILKQISKTLYIYILEMIIIIWCIFPTLTLSLGIEYSNIDNFIAMYCIGAYIRLWGFSEKTQRIINKCGIFFTFITLATPIIFIVIGKMTNIGTFSRNADFFTQINQINIVIMSIYIFLIFKNLKISNKVVNWIASSTLGIYLIHDDNIVSPYIWTVISPNNNYTYSKFLILHCFSKVMLVFIFCLIIDKILEFILSNTVYKLLCLKPIKNIEEKVDNKLNYE